MSTPALALLGVALATVTLVLRLRAQQKPRKTMAERQIELAAIADKFHAQYREVGSASQCCGRRNAACWPSPEPITARPPASCNPQVPGAMPHHRAARRTSTPLLSHVASLLA
jgi:hypothetical protein